MVTCDKLITSTEPPEREERYKLSIFAYI